MRVEWLRGSLTVYSLTGCVYILGLATRRSLDRCKAKLLPEHFFPLHDDRTTGGDRFLPLNCRFLYN